MPLTKGSIHKEYLYKARRLPEVASYMEGDIPKDEQSHEEWFERKISDPSCRLYTIYGPRGACGFAQLTNLFRYPSFGFYITNLEDRNQGIGKEVLRQLASKVFDRFGFDELHCRVKVTNHKALRLYLNFGFKTTNCLYNILELVLYRGDYLLANQQTKNSHI